MTDQNIEISEAVNAANTALYHLQKADDLLGHAENWGLVDMFGGGFLTTMIKRGKMSDAKREIEESKRALRNLARELRDVRGFESMDLDMDSFTGFADYFFDGVIADWFVQSKIGDARRQVKNAIAEVEGVLDGLERFE